MTFQTGGIILSLKKEIPIKNTEEIEGLARKLEAGGRGEARIAIDSLGRLAVALKAGKARAERLLVVAGILTVGLGMIGLKLYGWRVGQNLLAFLNGRLPPDVLFVLSLVLLFGPALAMALWFRRRWRLSVGWRPFDCIASFLESLPSYLTGTALVRMAVERRFDPLPEGHARDEWFRLEVELPGGGRCAVNGCDHIQPGMHFRTGQDGVSRMQYMLFLRTTLGCDLDFDNDRDVNPSELSAPFSLHAAQADGRWNYRIEKDNQLNDGSFRLVSQNDFSDLLGNALAITVVRACRCDEIVRSNDLFADHVAAGTLRLISETSADYQTMAVLECAKCRAKLRFLRDDSYHQPSIEWRKQV